MRTIAIINQKGGSGKTTTAINLAAVIAKRGLRTLLVDVDPQSHCALGLAIPENRIDLQIGDAMLAPDDRPIDTSRLLWRIAKDLDLAPCTTKLAGLEAARGGLADREDRDVRLRLVLQRLASSYDWCVIDCPPSIGLLTFNALRAAEEVLIPVETGYFAMRGAAKQVQTIRALCRRFGVSPSYRMLPTLHNEDSILSCDVLTQLQQEFEEALVPVVIREDSHLRESAALGVPVIDHAPLSRGAADYSALASWLIEHAPEPGEPGPAVEMIAPCGAPPSSLPVMVAAPEQRWDVDADETTEDPRVDRPYAPAVTVTPAASPVSRAAELAERTRRLVERGGEINRRLAPEPPRHGVVIEVEQIEPPGAGEAASAPSHATAVRPQPPRRTTTRERAAAPRFGVHFTDDGAWFVQPGGPHTSICIAGDHNGWNPLASVLHYNPRKGVHELCVAVPPGRYRYRLVVNGQWMADPYNPIKEPNPYGEINSVLVVEPRHTPAADTGAAIPVMED